MASVREVRHEFDLLWNRENASPDVIKDLLQTRGSLYIGEENKGFKDIKAFCASKSCQPCPTRHSYCKFRLRRKKIQKKTIMSLTNNIEVDAIQMFCPRSNISNDVLNFCRNATVLKRDMKSNPRIYADCNGITDEIFSIGHASGCYITRGVVCN